MIIVMNRVQKTKRPYWPRDLSFTLEGLLSAILFILLLIACGSPVLAQTSQNFEILDSQFSTGASGEADSENFGVSATLGHSSPPGEIVSETYSIDSGNPRPGAGQLLNLMDIDRVDIKWDKSEFSLKTKLELPPGVNPQTVAPEGRIVVGISSLGEVLDENIIMSVHGKNANKWEYRDNFTRPGIREVKIDWQGMGFEYNFEGLRLKSRHVGVSSTTIDIKRNNLMPENIQINIDNVVFDVPREGLLTIISNPMGYSILVDTSDPEEIEVELPFPLKPEMNLSVTVGLLSDTSIVGDHLTVSVGHLNVKGHFVATNADTSLLAPTLAAQVTIGARLFSGSDAIGTTDWKSLKVNRWKYDQAL